MTVCLLQKFNVNGHSLLKEKNFFFLLLFFGVLRGEAKETSISTAPAAIVHKTPMKHNILTQPENCFYIKKTPCAVKALSREKIQVGASTLILLNQALIVIKDFKMAQIDLLDKGYIIDKSPLFKIGSVELKKFPSFVRLERKKLEIIDGANGYLIRLDSDSGLKEIKVLDKNIFVKKMSYFFDRVGEFQLQLSKIKPAYLKSFENEIVKLQRIEKRSLASIDQLQAEQSQVEKKKEREDQNQKKLFFQRTFER